MVVDGVRMQQEVQQEAEQAADRSVFWRSLDGGLWVTRRGGRHLGLVERGRRFTASGADAEPLGAFRSLAEAQSAVAGPRGPVAGPRGPVPTAQSGSVGGGLLAGAVGLAAVALLATWTALVFVLPQLPPR